MGYHWPFLDYVNAPDSRTYAERCVKTLLGKPLLKQLEVRKVFVFEQMTMFSLGGFRLLDPPDNGFSVVLEGCWNFRDASLSKCFTFAHELGHTFGYDLATMSRLPHADPGTYDDNGTDEDNEEYNNILTSLENFADEFAFIWLSYVPHRRELEKFLEKHQSDTHVDLRLLKPPQ